MAASKSDSDLAWGAGIRTPCRRRRGSARRWAPG
jgi:hypothetical protein